MAEEKVETAEANTDSGTPEWVDYHVPSPYEGMLGQNVVVRSHMAGVYWGKVVATHRDGVTLGPGWRQAHYWTGAGACAGLSIGGPATEGRYTPPHPGILPLFGPAQVVTVMPTTPEADKAWSTVPDWTGAEKS
jgi:hypothetical protein